MAEVHAVTDDTFENEVLQAAEPTLVDFGAEWCAPCKMIEPIVEEVAQEYKGRLRVVEVNVDENPTIPQSLGIMGIPTLILFKGGAEVVRIVGYRTKEALVEELLAHIG